MSEVFIAKIGALNNRSRRDLRAAGIVVVEVPDISMCQFIRATEVVSADDMLWAAVDALNVRDNYKSGVDQRGKVLQESVGGPCGATNQVAGGC